MSTKTIGDGAVKAPATQMDSVHPDADLQFVASVVVVDESGAVVSNLARLAPVRCHRKAYVCDLGSRVIELCCFPSICSTKGLRIRTRVQECVSGVQVCETYADCKQLQEILNEQTWHKT